MLPDEPPQVEAADVPLPQPTPMEFDHNIIPTMPGGMTADTDMTLEPHGDEWTESSRKPKKDKKKRKSTGLVTPQEGPSVTDAEFVPRDVGSDKAPIVASESTLVTRDPVLPMGKEEPAQEGLDWAPPVKRSKKDKKKRKPTVEDDVVAEEDSRSVIADGTEEHSTERDLSLNEPGLPEVSMPDAEPGEPVEAEERAIPDKKAKKDKKKRKSGMSTAAPEPVMLSEGADSARVPLEVPKSREPLDNKDGSELPGRETASEKRIVEHVPVTEPEDFYRSTGSNRSVDHETSTRELPSAPDNDTAESTQLDQVSYDHLGVAQHDRQPLSENDNLVYGTLPNQPSGETTPDRAEDSDTGSQISETTRERQRRRRSPRMSPDYDPDNLPRSVHDRALTPPPENDDIMDTALGIAAGLGLGATALGAHESHAQPRSSHGDIDRPRGLSTQEDLSWSFPSPIQNRASTRDSGIHVPDKPNTLHTQQRSIRDSAPELGSPRGRERLDIEKHSTEVTKQLRRRFDEEKQVRTPSLERKSSRVF
ncbi:hypothetical protein LTR66_016906 [Elasticomyces elasticus]|nr:hypothetical protein LTR66_016906 [Elasticomyces elasticus]